ncbi:VanZ family protein [Caldimonas thermodepolymerans]|uniref:VanZ like protein n=1 Tax=Caldimonas thermodepolymerans TaxID=215580 RepID=A0A2S5T5F0_9BURK|nr:VanZ family protein [Caldimonas thermodepolymerans]PPE70224.1 hypothetical protein C1702_08180 [Caldimonas thermodepolymerans]QPC32219.1 VanZ family protein [Caldimonas thermodepolymerans]RDH98108.1 VanZ like protein [Caldimonas thermodepolymerans]TCP08117.1 VanZ like protein [Caldimonas thermodepolymerans]UZG45020.1 VanZ family protein [Caldimonas thermodepolymerans]
MTTAPHRTSLAPLAALYAALIVYASLYPFTGWRVPAISPFAFVVAPWPRWWTRFDLISNLLGYLPFGALACGALLRTGRPRWAAAGLATLAGTLLSGTMELLQNYLPARVPSNVDWGLNALGTLAGALLAVLVAALGWVGRWQQLRDRWFVPQSAGGLALLVSWPAALLFPTPVPLGLGRVGNLLHEALLGALAGTPWDGWIGPPDDAIAPPLPPGVEMVGIALGLLVPCLLAYAVTPRGWRRLVLVAGAALLGFGATTLSTALSFGPDHALAWVTLATPAGWIVGLVAALLLVAVPRRLAAALGLVAVTAMIALVHEAPADPYFASSLQNWEQGRFIRFHGIAQWVGWLWPYAVLLYLIGRTVARAEKP